MSRRKQEGATMTLRQDGAASYERQGNDKDALIDRALMVGFGGNDFDPANADVYNPRDHQRVPKAGAWAIITRQLPPIENRINEQVRVARIFYVEHVGNADDFGFAPNGSYKVKCRSPWGDVCLWPYEYSVMDPAKIVALWQSGDIVFHPTSTTEAAFNAIVFYARSRGIALADAMVMAVGTLVGPVGWFEPATAELAEDAEALERHVHRWPAFPPRESGS